LAVNTSSTNLLRLLLQQRERANIALAWRLAENSGTSRMFCKSLLLFGFFLLLLLLLLLLRRCSNFPSRTHAQIALSLMTFVDCGSDAFIIWCSSALAARLD
jgi:hypothetical protein